MRPGETRPAAVWPRLATRRQRKNGTVRSDIALAEDRDDSTPLGPTEQTILYEIARQTWTFFDVILDPRTSLPMDALDLETEPIGRTWTSPTDVGVYLWSVIAAHDLHLIDRGEALTRLARTLGTVESLATWNGLLHSWYDTATARPLRGPGRSALRPPFTGAFISTVDNAWFAVGLILTRQAFPELATPASARLEAMRFDLFFDDRDPRSVRSAGQIYGGYVLGQGPTAFHYDLLNCEARIAAYVGIGTGAMPGSVWWRTWRTLPADLTWQGQIPRGHTTTYLDPQSGQPYPVFEGHYDYAGISFVPSWGGSMFEALMPNLVVPEIRWGSRSFGQNHRNYTLAQIVYAHHALGYPVWGLSPASCPDEPGGYRAYGALALATNRQRSPYRDDAVTPHASFLALDVAPRLAFRNIQTLRARYAVDGPYGLLDAVNPVSGAVSRRYLVLDQGMILAALANLLSDHAMQRHFAADPVGAAIRPYLALEEFSIQSDEMAPG